MPGSVCAPCDKRRSGQAVKMTVWEVTVWEAHGEGRWYGLHHGREQPGTGSNGRRDDLPAHSYAWVAMSRSAGRKRSRAQVGACPAQGAADLDGHRQTLRRSCEGVLSRQIQQASSHESLTSPGAQASAISHQSDLDGLAALLATESHGCKNLIPHRQSVGCPKAHAHRPCQPNRSGCSCTSSFPVSINTK